MEPGTLATNVWASAWRPDEMHHVPLDRGVLLFLSSQWNVRTRRQESAWLAAALPSTNLRDGESTQRLVLARPSTTSMSTRRPTQRAQSFRRITDGPRGHALIRRLGGMQGRRTAFSGQPHVWQHKHRTLGRNRAT